MLTDKEKRKRISKKKRQLTKEEIEGLKKSGNEDLIRYSRCLLAASRDEYKHGK